MSLNVALLKSAKKFESWMKDECLPLWASQGIDDASGGHYEQIPVAALPNVPTDIRVRVQARQAFSYAFAACHGWLPSGAAMADQLLDFMESNARHPERPSGFTHLMDANFNIIDTRQDLYDHAFVFLAYAWVYKATANENLLQRASALLKYWDAQFGSLAGGWIEGDYEAPHRRQNPHMHLFEAFMSLYEATRDAQWLARASEIFTLFQMRFFDTKRGVVLEYFNADWQPYKESQGTQIEPGHMFEWVWLLHWYQRLSGHDVSYYTRTLYSQAMHLGFSPESKLMFDYVYIDENAQVTSRSKTKRCWPITELVKAHIAEARAGNSESQAQAAKAIELLFTYFVSAQLPGAYYDQRGENDQIINATTRASTLYHLVVACGEVSRYCRDRLAGKR